MFNILIAEDNKDLRDLFTEVLTNAGFKCFPVCDGLEALDVFEKEYIDLIVADIMMPGMNGYELTSHLRKANYYLPVLMVTAMDDYSALKQGFESGSDDYMVKPVNLEELVIRVRALLRRAKIVCDKKITFGSCTLDYNAMSVFLDGEEIALPQKEFLLLYKFLSYPNKIFTRQQLMDEIWGMETETDDRTLNTHINRLRERFIHCKDFSIITVRGLGYKAVKNETKN